LREGATSDLSIDEALMLHSIEWEPVDLVCGVSMTSIPIGVWNWGSGEITAASTAVSQAAASATARLQAECASVGGHGVVGVRVHVDLHRHHTEMTLVGTAARPVDSTRPPAVPFVSDLSGRDFALLHQAGWQPVGLAFGAGYTYVPRRSLGTTLQQKRQNVELTNYTEAMYAARESAMERMQRSALAVGAEGVVAVVFSEGPVGFATHAIGFIAWGTAVVLGPGGHRSMAPQMAVTLDDAVVAFEARSLRE
jgi:uncharacterized protein YbjQ (UPF0145 family)